MSGPDSRRHNGPPGNGGPARRSAPSHRANLALLCAAQLTNLMDLSLIQVALPAVQADLGVPAQQLQWLITAYSLTFGGLLLLCGRLGDLLGRRRMLTLGMALLAISALGGLASGISGLVAARILKGAGAALAMPATMSLLTTTFPEGEARSRALGVLNTASSAGFALGLIVGGVLTDALGWRWVFLGNLPIAGTIAILTPRMLPESERVRQPVDVAGALTVTAGLALLVYACSAWGSGGLAPATLAALLVAALLSLALFVRIQAGSPAPLVPLDVFRNPMLAAALVAGGVFGAVIGPSLFMLTFYLQSVVGFDPLTAGFAFLPQEAVVLTCAPLLGRLVGRTGPRPVLTAGLTAFGAAALVLTGISAQGGYVPVALAGILLLGAGVSGTIVAGSVAATTGLPAHLHGLASGLWNAAPQVGASLGMAALLPVANAVADGVLASGANAVGIAPAAAIPGFRAAFLAALVFVVLGLGTVFFRMPHGPSGARLVDKEPV